MISGKEAASDSICSVGLEKVLESLVDPSGDRSDGLKACIDSASFTEPLPKK